MKNRRAILFFLAWSIAFALALALLSFGRHPAEDSHRPYLSALDVGKVAKLELDRARPGGAVERIRLSRTGGRWRIEAPISAEADDATVKRMVNAVAFAEPVDALSQSDMASLGRSLRDFGLSSPKITVMLASEEGQETIEVGRVTHFGDEVYVRRDGEDGVFTVSVQVERELSRPLDELRRRRLFTIGRGDVAAIGMRGAGGKFSRLTKEKGSWRLTEPMEAPADKAVVEELIGELCSAQANGFAAAGAHGVPAGMGDSEGYFISLRDSFGNVEKLVLGPPASTNEIWALTPEGVVVRTDAALLPFCRKRQKMLEDTRVFPAEPQSVISYSIADGYPAYLISHTNAAAPWRMTSPVDATADADLAKRMLERILALRGVDLAQDPDKGALSISVATDYTNFPVRMVSASFLPDGFRLDNLRDKLLVRYARADVRRIRVKTAAGIEWDATASEPLLACIEKGIIAETVERVAVREEDLDRYGLKSPSCTLSLELNGGDSAMRKLLLGAAAPGGGRFAMIGGTESAFVLSAATVSALTKPVDETLEKTR